MKKIINSVIGLALIVCASPIASAVMKNYEIGNGSSVNANSSDPGLVVHTSILGSFAGSAFSLNDGESTSLGFFDIWTDETHVNGDDKGSKAISATIDFSAPVTSGTVDGDTDGHSFLFGLVQWGTVQWDGPTLLTVADRAFSISLSDAKFNKGLFGLKEGERYGATIEATITQLKSRDGGGNSSSVPDGGSTVALLGLSIFGLCIARKRVAK